MALRGGVFSLLLLLLLLLLLFVGGVFVEVGGTSGLSLEPAEKKCRREWGKAGPRASHAGLPQTADVAAELAAAAVGVAAAGKGALCVSSWKYLPTGGAKTPKSLLLTDEEDILLRCVSCREECFRKESKEKAKTTPPLICVLLVTETLL